jgi:hypothetical protein
MNTRFIIGLLCAGALAFACGPRSRSEAPSSLAVAQTVQPVRVSQADVATHVQGTPRSNHRGSARAGVRLDSHFDVFVAPQEVRFALNVKNVGGKHAQLDFPNGQMYDIIVVDSIGREVWRWGKDRMFTQNVQNKQLGGGEEMQIAESWKPNPGHYTAIATLTSSNYPVEERAEFVVR